MITSVAATVVLVAAMITAVPAAAALTDPAVPELVAPAPGASFATNPVLTWDPVPGASRYRVQVSSSPAFASPAYDQETVATTATPPTDLPEGDLYWRVAAEDATRQAGPFSDYRTFTKTPTAPPTPVAPEDGATLSFPDDPPVFSWTPVPGAESYTLEVDDAADFIGATSYVTANTSYTLSTPQTPGQTFFWRVSATSSGGVNTSAPSDPNSYTVAWDSTPTLISPPDALAPPLADVVLAWDPVPGAATYHLQVSPNGDWANNLSVDVSGLKSTRYSPPQTLDNGAYFWRVQATDAAGDNGAWSDTAPSGAAQFTRGWVHGSAQSERVTLLAPAWTPGGGIPHVDGSLGLRWSPVHHASHYEIEISSDINFSPGQSQICYTNHTEFEPYSTDIREVLPGICPIGGLHTGVPYYWHVRPVDDGPTRVTGVFGVWSNTGNNDTFRFILDPLRPQEIAPANGATVTVPTLSWQPVTGAEKYLVSIYRANGLALIGSPFTTYGTSFTPAGLLAVDDSPYSWYVQSVDANQNTSAAPALSDARTFSLDTLNGIGSTPTLTGPASDSSSVRMPALTWTPVTGADTYVVHVAANGFELAPLGTGLHYPAYTPLKVPLAPDTYTWWVEARKDDVGTLSYSGTSTFTITRPDVLSSADYLGPAKCAQPGTCTPVADTPTLHWNSVPDAAYYLVSIANDPNFTNVLRVYGTAYTTLTPRESLVDNQAGQAYYWFVRPCVDSDLTDCGPAAQDDTANDNASAFQKESNPIALTSPAVDANVPQQVTFSWDDFLDTNGSAAVTATQEARQYQVQVSTSADFATILDSATVDQTTYTASAKTYPEGPIYWRVQAIDESKNHLTWSPAQRLVKQSPAVQPSSPAQSATVSGVPTLLWQPSDYAATYSVEVYKNGDTTFSVANRVINVSGLKFSAYTPTIGLPSGDYAWRVRAVDAGAQVRPWSAGRTFTLQAAAPPLLAPADGATLGADPVFSWDAVPGAVRYTAEVSTSASFASTAASQTTVMSAWAPTSALPDGTLYWRVRVLDAGGHVIAISAVRSFSHDQSAPRVTSHLPSTTVDLVGPVTAGFSEAVENVTGASFQVTPVGSTATVAGRVTRTATTATWVPQHALVPGGSYQVTLTSGITDATGNPLSPYSWTVRAATTVENVSPALHENWERGTSPKASGGRYDASATAGDRATFTFHGSTVTLLGTRGPDGGYASLYLDGVRKIAKLSFHHAKMQWQHAMWSAHGLSDGVHTLQLRPTGTHPSGAKGNWVYLDAMKVGSTLYQETSTALVERLRRVADSSASGGSYDRAMYASGGDDRSAPSFTTTFHGPGVSLRVLSAPEGGTARIYLDGKLVQKVSTQSSIVLHNYVAYTSPTLKDAAHTLTVRVAGTRTGAKSMVAIDMVQVR